MTNKQLRETVTQLLDRVSQLETKAAENEQLKKRVERLEAENDRLQTDIADYKDQLGATGVRIEAVLKRSKLNKRGVDELQAREIKKGAHLKKKNIDIETIDVDVTRLETIIKNDKKYNRLLNSGDPLDQSSQISLAHADLLPVQQLARLDDNMLRSVTSSRPDRLAAKLWKAREDDTVGDSPWKRGSQTIREFVKASDLKHWIRRQDPGISDSYAKKLVSRTIDALLDLTKNRVAIRRKTERKNGLSYKERRIILPAESSIPGEFDNSSADETEDRP